MNTGKMRAVMLAADEGKRIEYCERGNSQWKWAPCPYWDWNNYDYRVKPEPKRVPRTMDDLPEGGALWVRKIGNSAMRAVTEIHGDRVFWAKGDVVSLCAFERGMALLSCDEPLEISADRKTWLPWWKEVSE